MGGGTVSQFCVYAALVHFRPPGLHTINPKPIQKACRDDEDIINAICEEQKELTETQGEARRIWSEEKKAIRPHSEDWEYVAFL